MIPAVALADEGETPSSGGSFSDVPSSTVPETPSYGNGLTSVGGSAAGGGTDLGSTGNGVTFGGTTGSGTTYYYDSGDTYDAAYYNYWPLDGSGTSIEPSPSSGGTVVSDKVDSSTETDVVSGGGSTNGGGSTEDGVVEDSRSDLEKAEDDLAEKRGALNDAKEDFDKADEKLDQVNSDIHREVTAIHDKATDDLDEAQGTYDDVKGSDDAAKADLTQASRERSDAETAAGEAEKAYDATFDEVEAAQHESFAELNKYVVADDEAKACAEAEQKAHDELKGVYVEPDVVAAQRQDYIDADKRYDEARDNLYGKDMISGAYGAYTDALNEAKEAAGEDKDVSSQLDSFEQSVDDYLSARFQYEQEGKRKTAAEESRDALANSIAQTESEMGSLRNETARLNADADQLTKDVSELDAAKDRAKATVSQKESAVKAAENEVIEARKRYQNAKAALDEATPATLAGLEAEATASIDALNDAVAARDKALTEMRDAEDEKISVESEYDQMDRRLGDVSERLSSATDRLEELKADLAAMKADLNGDEGAKAKARQMEQQVKDAEKAVNDARSKYTAAIWGLYRSLPNDNAKATAVSNLIGVASKLMSAFEAFCPASSALAKAEDNLKQYGKFNENWDRNKSYNENNLAGLDAYAAKYDAWQKASDALYEANQLVKTLDGSVRQRIVEYDEAWQRRYRAKDSLEAASGALEVAKARESVAEARKKVLGEALDEAKADLDDAKAAYDRAMAVTEDKVRSGTVTDEDYAYLNEYKAPYEEAKAAYDVAKAAYGEARAAYNKSFAEYQSAWHVAHPVEEQVREAVDKYFDRLEDNSSVYYSSGSSSSAPAVTATLIKTTPATSPETPAAQKAPAQVAESVASQAKVEGVTGGEVKVVAEPALSEVAQGVYEVESMPEVDVEALVANDPEHKAADVSELWWCVTIDGVKVRIMNAKGVLASGIARVVWADDADAAQAALAGIDSGDGRVIVLTPDMELTLVVVWA